MKKKNRQEYESKKVLNGELANAIVNNKTTYKDIKKYFKVLTKNDYLKNILNLSMIFN